MDLQGSPLEFVLLRIFIHPPWHFLFNFPSSPQPLEGPPLAEGTLENDSSPQSMPNWPGPSSPEPLVAPNPRCSYLFLGFAHVFSLPEVSPSSSRIYQASAHRSTSPGASPANLAAQPQLTERGCGCDGLTVIQLDLNLVMSRTVPLIFRS